MRAWPLAALLALGAAPAAAQVVIGGGTRPSVEVDLGAINGAGAPSAGVTPGYDRPLLVPPVDPPKLKPPRRSTEKKASPSRKTAAKPPKAAPEVKPAPPEPKIAAPAPPPPSQPPAALPTPAAAPPPIATAPAPFPPAPSAPVGAVTSAPAPPPQAFSAAPASEASPQTFAPAPPQALTPAPQPRTAAPAAPSKPEPEPERPTQTASLPPAGGDLMLEFKGDSAELGRGASDQLRALAARLKDKDTRLQLKAYASGGADGASRAKRVSLSRGLAVRSYLIDQGMRSTQIDVRALGPVRDGGPEDRVDVVVLTQ